MIAFTITVPTLVLVLPMLAIVIAGWYFFLIRPFNAWFVPKFTEWAERRLTKRLREEDE